MIDDEETYANRPLLGPEKLSEYEDVVFRRSSGTSRSKTLLLILFLLAGSICVNVFQYIFQLDKTSRYPIIYHGLATESLIGTIPWRDTILENDETSINASPEEGVASVWDDIYPSTWVAIPNAASKGLRGGVNLRKLGMNSSAWDSGTEAYGVAVMHQLHCVRSVKNALQAEDRSVNFYMSDPHLGHCVEVLRQAILCHGDLSLETPSAGTAGTFAEVVTGWGNTHACRDQDAMLDAIWAHSVIRSPHGWRPTVEVREKFTKDK